MTKLLQQCFLFFIVVVIPGHNLGNSQVSVNRTSGPTLVIFMPPTLKKLMGHIAFGACVGGCVRGWVRGSHFLYLL